MPKVSTFSAVQAIGTGKRGRKAKVWNRDDYRIAPGQALDLSDDLAAACRVEVEVAILAATDRSLLTDEQGKKYTACIAEARLRAAEANGMPKTESGGYSVSGVVFAPFTGEQGDFVGLHIPDAVEVEAAPEVEVAATVEQVEQLDEVEGEVEQG